MSRSPMWSRSFKQKVFKPPAHTEFALRYRRKIIERDLPPRTEMRDSKGQPISPPCVSILKEKRL